MVHAIYVLGSMALFSIGLYGLLARRHLIKIFIAIAIMELSVYLLFIALATSPGETAPILADGLTRFAGMADPVPQALTLTAIVIGMAVLAFGVTLAIHYHRLTGIRDIDAMTELKD
jgi:multisubunit Na+/H+ antiporter MnhC subunit